MSKLFKSTLIVPDCPKSITRKIHIRNGTFKPTRVIYTFYCSERRRKIDLIPKGFEGVIAVGCGGCIYKQSGVERS